MRSVYLIRGNDGKYKIGIGKNPRERIMQLQTGNPDRLEIIDVYESENASKIESVLHNRYSYARNVGEWFDLSVAEESSFIKNCMKIDESINLLKKMGNVFV
jgi:hypothetical protein